MSTHLCVYTRVHVRTRSLPACSEWLCQLRIATRDILKLSKYHTMRCCFCRGAVTNPARMESGPSEKYVCVLDLQRALNLCTSILELCLRQSAVRGAPGCGLL